MAPRCRVKATPGRGFQTFGGHDPHPDVFEKAVVLMRGIVQGHPFSDGNKRTGVLLAMYFLEKFEIPEPGPLPVIRRSSFRRWREGLAHGAACCLFWMPAGIGSGMAVSVSVLYSSVPAYTRISLPGGVTPVHETVNSEIGFNALTCIS